MTDRKTLRKSFDKLTPYEKACLKLREAMGRKRLSVVEEIAKSSTVRDMFWIQVWEDGIASVASFAFSRALALYMYALGRLGNVDIMAPGKLERRLKGDRGEDIRPVDYLSKAYIWILALAKLERETGAPFLACDGLIVQEVLPLVVPPIPDGWDLVFLYDDEYRTLRAIWDALWTAPNEEDAHRRLPPLPPKEGRDTDERGRPIVRKELLGGGKKPGKRNLLSAVEASCSS